MARMKDALLAHSKLRHVACLADTTATFLFRSKYRRGHGGKPGAVMRFKDLRFIALPPEKFVLVVKRALKDSWMVARAND